MTTIPALFVAAVAAHADRPALHLVDRVLSYADLGAMVERYAAALAELGVGAGDRVAVRVEKTHEVIALYLATLRVGAVHLPLNTGYTGSELSFFIADAAPRIVVCDPAAEATVTAAATEAVEAVESTAAGPAGSAGTAVLTLGPGDTGTFGELVATADASPARSEPEPESAPEPGPDDPAAILYTSGTTGRSKGAVITHRNLASNRDALVEAWRITRDDVLVHALPLFHAHGLFVALNTTLTTGAAVHLLPRFDADRILALLPEATLMMGVPTHYTRLLDHPGLTVGATGRMRLFVSGSAPLGAATHQTFAERTGHAILERYGMTETQMMTSNPYDGERRPGTVGMPLPGIAVRVADRASGVELPPGEIGSIQVRGPNVFREYRNLPDRTAEEFTADGYFVTGDLGVYDGDGYLSIVGRDKDLVICGGYNVYPKEIEVLLDAQPGVLESAVVGVPHADLGEAPVAVVVRDPGGDAEPSADELLASVGGALARYKRPRAVVFVDALPRNVMGKVTKAELRANWDELSQG